jgi:ZIP family zinc transporter
MTTLPLMFGMGATLATVAGGLLALRLRHRINLMLGITAGVVFGVVVFDLLPEAMALAGNDWDARALIMFVALGLGFYMVLDRGLEQTAWLPERWRKNLSPATLTLHSLMDGMGIGLAFQIDSRAGWLIALAVLTHDIADGVNTVSLCLAARSNEGARRWLVLNGSAPMVGVLLGLSFKMPPVVLAPLLAGFAGMFLYISACELLPRSYAMDPRLRTTFASISGMTLMFAVTHLSALPIH